MAQGIRYQFSLHERLLILRGLQSRIDWITALPIEGDVLRDFELKGLQELQRKLTREKSPPCGEWRKPER